jgi:hypothetical protein
MANKRRSRSGVSFGRAVTHDAAFHGELNPRARPLECVVHPPQSRHVAAFGPIRQPCLCCWIGDSAVVTAERRRVPLRSTVSRKPASRRTDACSVSRKGRLRPKGSEGVRATAGRGKRPLEERRRARARRRPSVTLPHIPAEWVCLVGRFLGRGHGPSCRWSQPWVREMQFPDPFTYLRRRLDRGLGGVAAGQGSANTVQAHPLLPVDVTVAPVCAQLGFWVVD